MPVNPSLCIVSRLDFWKKPRHTGRPAKLPCTTFPRTESALPNVAPAHDVRKVVCAVECADNQVDPSHCNEARTRTIGVLSGLQRRKFISPLSAEKRRAVKQLQPNSEIVILRADKKSGTVLSDTAVYKCKILALLDDPTLKVQRDLQALLADLFCFVPPECKSLYYMLLCHNGAALALYGLPKVHKPNVPLRPLSDYTRSLLYKLSGYLHKILSTLVGKGSTLVSNSCDFIEKVCDVTIDNDEVTVSFNVASLLTSIPTDIAVEACTSVLESERTLPDRSPIDVPDLKRLLCFCFENALLLQQGLLQARPRYGNGSLCLCYCCQSNNGMAGKSCTHFLQSKAEFFCAMWATVFASFGAELWLRSLRTCGQSGKGHPIHSRDGGRA